MNYPAIAAGAERVFRYILGVGAAETSASLLVQGEGISHEDGDFLYLIDGGLPAVRSAHRAPWTWCPGTGSPTRRRYSSATASPFTAPAGEKLTQVEPVGDGTGEVFRAAGAQPYDLRSFETTSDC